MRKKTTPPAKPRPLVVNDPKKQPGILKAIGGSQSDDWNSLLINQVASALWLKNSDPETCDDIRRGAIVAMMGIAPRDELEGMMAGQLLAAHNAAMECFRRAMIGDQTFESRRENLNQANKLTRSFATLLEALNRHRGKGQQKVTVEHVHVHRGGQAIVGTVEAPGGRVSHENRGSSPCNKIPHADTLAVERKPDQADPAEPQG